MASFAWVPGDADNTVHGWRRLGRIKFLVMHDPVAGSPAALLRYLRQNDRRVSYHDVILPGAPPRVHVLVNGAEVAVGQAGYGTAKDCQTGRSYGQAVGGNLNDWSWGICIYKHKDDNGPFPPALYRAAVDVAAYRAEQFGVAVCNILAHREVDPRRRGDPRGLPMDAFRRDVAKALGV